VLYIFIDIDPKLDEQPPEKDMYSYTVDANSHCNAIIQRARASKHFVLWCKPSTDLVEGFIHVGVKTVCHFNELVNCDEAPSQTV
jgi:hypothetical protein